MPPARSQAGLRTRTLRARSHSVRLHSAEDSRVITYGNPRGMLSTFEVDQRARKCLQASVPDDWTLTPPTDDLGLDYWVQVTEGGIPKNVNFFIQVKGSQSLQAVGTDIKHVLSTKKMLQYLETPLPVLFVVCHISSKGPRCDVAYYCWIRQYVRNTLEQTIPKPEAWMGQKTMTIRIPRSQVLTPSACVRNILPFLESFTARHVAQEEHHISFLQRCEDLAEILQNCEHYFSRTDVTSDSESVLRIKQLLVAGHLLAEQARHAEAIAYFQAANALLPMPDTWLSQSYSHEALGDLSATRTACAEGLKLDPENVFLWSNMGTALFRLGRLEEALSCHERVVHMQEQSPRLWANLAATLEYLASTQAGGKARETLLRALVCFEKALELDDSDASILSDMGLVLNKLYRFPQAIHVLERAVSLAPQAVSAWLRLGNACLSERDYGRAREVVDHLVAMGVDGKETRTLAALVDMNRQGEHADSWAELMQAMRDSELAQDEPDNKDK